MAGFHQPGGDAPALSRSCRRPGPRSTAIRRCSSGSKNPVSFAVGAEYRKYTASSVPTRSPRRRANSAAPAARLRTSPAASTFTKASPKSSRRSSPIGRSSRNFSSKPVSVGRTTRSMRHRRSRGQRFSDPEFNTTTWKVAGSWAPVRDIKFRGNYNHAVRAPNIAELFTPADDRADQPERPIRALALPPHSPMPTCRQSVSRKARRRPDRQHPGPDCRPGEHHHRW